MKKMITFVLAVIIAFSAVTASAATPDFLYQVYTNYSSEQTMSVKFKSGEDIKNLLEELKLLDDISKVVDVEMLLSSLLSLEYDMEEQCNISDDFKQMELAVQIETDSSIEPNNNLKIDVNAKTGIWYSLDLEEEKFEMIVSSPNLSKYAYYNFAELLPETERNQFFGVMKLLYKKPVMEQIRKFSTDLVAKYADIKVSGTKYTVKIDNDALISIVDELIVYILDITEALTGESAGIEIPSLEGLKILGEKGITCKYSLMGGKPSKVEMSADISIDISNIFALVTGEEWEYESKGIIQFEIESSGKISKYGKTKVELPTLTDENSFNIMELIPVYEPYEPDYDYGQEIYPYDWIDCYTDDMPKIDGQWYVPLRNTLVSAFEDSMEIEFSNDVITLGSKYFPGYETVELKLNSDIAVIDGEEVKISHVYEENGISFVSVETIETLFGWELNYAYYDIMEGYYNYGFYSYE